MTNKTVLPPKIENQDELPERQRLLSRLKIVENGLRYDKLKNREELSVFLAFNSGETQKFAFNLIGMFLNMNILTENPDGTLELSKTFPYFMQGLRRIITLAEKNEKIMSPFSYFQKKLYGEAKP